MKIILQRFQSHLSSFIFQNNIDLNNKDDVLNQLNHGTTGFDKSSPQYDEELRKNVLNIVGKVDKKQAKEVLMNNEKTRKLVENSESEKTNEENETSTTNIDKISSPQKKGIFGRMKESVGSYVATGAKYGALIMGGIGSIVGTIAALSAGVSATGSMPILAVAVLGFLAGGALGAFDGMINGAILGAIIGLIKKGIDKKEAKN